MFKHNNQSCSVLVTDSRLDLAKSQVLINNVLAAYRYFMAFWGERGEEDFKLSGMTFDRKLKSQPELKLHRGDEHYLVFRIVPHVFV